jgi:hypothetical protein
MLVFREPERSVLPVREHRKLGKAAFAAQHQPNGDTGQRWPNPHLAHWTIP